MNTNLKTLTEQLKQLFDKLTSTQKITLVTFTVLTVLAIGALMIFVNQPQYTILYSDLSPNDASAVRDQLQDAKITYQLRDGGNTILVPKDQVYDLRLQLAAEGIPGQVGAGYEIFDRTNLGMSDFVQKLNYRRALEGELARTIANIAEVEQARVHVVIPEAALFREDEKETTASVVLKMKSRARLQEGQVKGISVLISSAVEGLEPENVTILDSYGNLLSSSHNPDQMVGLTSTQMELQHNIEAHLAYKAQTMLDRVLGPGRSIVRLSTELDFQSIERTREIYDPESAVVRSEERTETEMTGGDSPQTREENSLSNYEINKTVEHLVDTGGSIMRMSVAVMVDGHYTPAEDGTMTYSPRTNEEMNSLTNMVRGALGVREDRGDELQITNIAFDKETFVEADASLAGMDYQELILALAPKIILGFVLLMLLMMIRGFLKKNLSSARQSFERQPSLLPQTAAARHAQLMPGAPTAAQNVKAPKEPLAPVELDEEVPQDVRKSEAERARIATFANEKPEIATMLL
ncbi:flagellar M-ring protein FliF, partial [bacterium]|nr:flagellar M-ring protein FliF [bacterium]